MNKQEIYSFLKKMPIAINNYYGDPTLQWENTINKIKRLSTDKHEGPVGLLTRGFISPERALELADASNGLKLVVLVSISGLPESIEPVSTKARYQTMKNCLAVGLPVLVAVRPIIMSINGKEDILLDIVENSVNAGAKNFIFSGIRGNDEILTKSNLTKEELEIYTLRVKVMPPNFGNFIEKITTKFNIDVSTRVACGVSKILDLPRCYNHYQSSPLLSRCNTCSFKNRCYQPVKVEEKAVELVKALGYDVTVSQREQSTCNINPAIRKDCPSCCTCCFMQDNTRFNVMNEHITLGDLGFIRFLTGIPAVKPGVVDGSPDAGHVNMPILQDIDNIHTVNSWYVLSRNTQKCYDCSYCIVNAYSVQENEHGLFPADLAILLEERIKNPVNLPYKKAKIIGIAQC